jgi:hypothetical protein
MSKGYERKVQTRETLIEVALILLLVARLARFQCRARPAPSSRIDILEQTIGMD